MAIVDGFENPKDESGKPLPTTSWTKEICKKAQANAKATTTLQCGLSKDQLSKIGPFNSAKELWEKLIELNEGSSDSRRAKKDLLVEQLQNFTMRQNETVSQMHGRFKEIVNGLHVIGEKLDNRDLEGHMAKECPNKLKAPQPQPVPYGGKLSLHYMSTTLGEPQLSEGGWKPH
ncbi:uncharacterized protein LOC141842889 [Curcuma longa]|uniref:uncharacterized protein LOC141842889 n=1 Tax=Curcuma longa TaxID=136217 RepID=UPI003D9E9CFB